MNRIFVDFLILSFIGLKYLQLGLVRFLHSLNKLHLLRHSVIFRFCKIKLC